MSDNQETQDRDQEHEPDSDSEVIQFVEHINTLGDTFEELCRERHRVGQEEYGAFTFLGNDVIRMMLEELADVVNYCRMQGVKLLLLQGALEDQLAGSPLVEDGQQEITIGVQAFKGVKDVGWSRK